MFPLPRHVDVHDGPGSVEVHEVVRDRSIPAQGYELAITRDGATVRHADPAGERYARATLAQLAVEGNVRAQRVVDHPDVEHRGFMLDISRDRVPTRETLAGLVAVLATLRYNHFELYMEHTFAYDGHDDVWVEASALSAEDVRWLDDLCLDHGIELVANQNTFGHMERWLRHDEHRWRAECPDGATSLFGGARIAPATLAPTSANAEFALTLVRELASHVRSRTVHIGADEPFELGQGVSQPQVASVGRATVYLEHLDRLVRPLIAEGRHVLFWGDVLRRHPLLVGRLPTDGATAVVWNYEAPSPEPGLLSHLGPDLLDALGLPDDAHLGFESHVRSFADTGYPFWVAPGTSTWNSVLGRWSNARANILDAAEVGTARGARGLLLTDWGDNGHLQPLAVSLPALVYAAGVAWCRTTNHSSDPAPSIDALTGVAGLGQLLIELGDAYLRPGVTSFNGSALFAALDPGRPLPLLGRGHAAGHADTIEFLDDALLRLDGLGAPQPELEAAVRCARHGAWRLARRAGAPGPGPAEMADDLRHCRELHRSAWAISSRPGGLRDSLRHLPDPDADGPPR